MVLEERIRRDAALFAGDPEAAALVVCFGKHLCDPTHDVGSMLKVCGASRPAQKRLAAKLGPLKTWVTEVRMEEGARLVRETEDPIQELCKQAGYPSDRTFRRVFREHHGESPSEMRRRLREERARAELAAAGEPGADGDGSEDAELDDGGKLHPLALAALLQRRTALGLLDARRAAELRRRLRRGHRCLDEPAQADDAPDDGTTAYEQHPILLTPTGDDVEELSTNAVLGEVIDAPEDEARFLMLRGVVFGNVGSYRQLQKLCAGIIPHKPERALLLAELAVQMIRGHRPLMGDEGDQWQADAWVFLARVQAFLGHTGDADQSLAFACAEVGGARHLAPWVEIELRQVEGLLRQRQRRHEEAARALDRAVELGRDLEPLDSDRGLVVLRRLELASAVNDVETGEALADELEELVEGQAERDAAAGGGQRFTLRRGYVSYHRARAAAADGRDCCAHRHLLQTVNGIAADPDSDTDDDLGMLYAFGLHQLSRLAWRAGELDQCETWLRSVLERYRHFQLPVLEAAAEAELAVMCALRGRQDEARRLARAAASFLDDLPFHREAWNAARRLCRLAAEDAEAGEDELRDFLGELRRDLDLVAWEITGSQARPAFETRRGLR